MPDVRTHGDQQLAESLLRLPEVQQAIEKFEKSSQDMSARRHLLATSLRLSQEMAPDVAEIMRSCARTLGISAPIETYVYPGAMFNAAAVKPEKGRLFVILSSSLLEGFEEDELKFVVGHELGHHVYEHHRIPVAALLQGRPPISAGLALQLFAWQRYAEISCDRAGMLCTGNLDSAARSLFKLASGLKSNRVQVNIGQFLAQAGDLRNEVESSNRADETMRSDWFSTHPFSPLRLVAAQLFAKSEFMQKAGVARNDLETQVDDIMGVMSPSYLSEDSEVAEHMRRLLFAAAVVLANASGSVSEVTLKALRELLGHGRVPDDLDQNAIKDVLPSRSQKVKEQVPLLRRAQVIRDLCVIARANGHIDAKELKIIREVAAAIDVDADSITCLEATTGSL